VLVTSRAFLGVSPQAVGQTLARRSCPQAEPLGESVIEAH